MTLNELINKLKNDVRFGAERKEAMRGRLLQFMEAHEVVREGESLRHISQRSSIASFFLKPISMPIVAIIIILSLTGGGVSFAAESALPGDILYPVKVHINENVVAALSVTSEAKADWETTLAGRRLEEAAELAAKDHVSAEAKAQLENDFETHAERAKAKIHEIEVRGNVEAAAGAASRFEGVLKAHEAVLGRIEAESKSEEEANEVRPLKAKVQLELDDVLGVRENLESKVSSHADESNDAKVEVKAAAEGKLNAAANVIASTRAFIESKKTQLGAQATADAEARLKAAENLVVEGKAKLQAEDYGEAFHLGNQAIRFAQEARLLLNANADFKINVRIGGDNEDNLNTDNLNTKDSAENETSASSTIEQKNNEEQSVTASSSVNVQTEDRGAGSRGELKLKVEL